MKTVYLSIHEEGRKLTLTRGNYTVLIVGGFYVDEHNFSISITAVEDQSKIKIKRIDLASPQLVQNEARAKRYFSFEIERSGDYDIQFHNPTSLKVWRNHLWTLRLLFGPIDNSNIRVAIEKN